MTATQTDADLGTVARFTPARLVREVAASGLAAAAAGVLAGGVGGRIVMRVSALINPDLIGARSENGNRIGDITAAGTIELLLFGGLLAGMVAAWAWVAIRPWLPERGPVRAVSASFAAVGLTGFFVITSDNFDFAILDPAWLHVAMFTSIVALAGWLTNWFDRRFIARLADAPRFTVVAVVIVGVGLSLIPAAVGSFFSSDFCFCGTPPRPTGGLLLIALGATIATWVMLLKRLATPPRVRFVGAAATVGAVTTGLVHLAGQVSEIL